MLPDSLESWSILISSRESSRETTSAMELQHNLHSLVSTELMLQDDGDVGAQGAD